MDAMTEEQLLNDGFEALGFSASFCSSADKMGVKKIADVITKGPEALIRCEGFTFHWLSELIDFLRSHGKAGLLHQLPAKENTSG